MRAHHLCSPPLFVPLRRRRGAAVLSGHADDFYHYLSGSDYAWLTSELVAVMAPRGGRVVSVLEGGYSTAPLKEAAGTGGRNPGKVGKAAAAVANDEPREGGLADGVRCHIAALAGIKQE